MSVSVIKILQEYRLTVFNRNSFRSFRWECFPFFETVNNMQLFVVLKNSPSLSAEGWILSLTFFPNLIIIITNATTIRNVINWRRKKRIHRMYFRQPFFALWRMFCLLSFSSPIESSFAFYLLFQALSGGCGCGGGETMTMTLTLVWVWVLGGTHSLCFVKLITTPHAKIEQKLILLKSNFYDLIISHKKLNQAIFHLHLMPLRQYCHNFFRLHSFFFFLVLSYITSFRYTDSTSQFK